MNSSTMTPTQQAQLSLLSHHFSGMGALLGTDLLSGKSYERFYLDDTSDFFAAHLLGPGRYRSTTGVVAEDRLGELHQLASFYRCQCRALDDNKVTSTISLTLTGQPGLEPTQEVCSIVEHLQEMGWPVIVERSFRLLRWTIWMFLDSPIVETHAKDIAYRMYCLIRDYKLIAEHLVEVPLIDDGADKPHLPFQFFSGDFFGMLHQLHGHQLQPLDFADVPHFDVFCEKSVSRSFVCEEAKQNNDALFTTWWQRFKQHRVRAGDLLTMLDDEDISIDSLVPPGESHRRTIELGQYLKALEDRSFCGTTMHSRRSGNGTVFWLVQTEEGHIETSPPTTNLPSP